MISNEDFLFIQEKYGKLIYKAANAIGGDVSRNAEDYVNEMWITLLKYFEVYPARKECASIKEFCAAYDNYVKQWIWTLKNHYGEENTLKIKVRGTKTNIEDANLEFDNFLKSKTNYNIEDTKYSALLTYDDNTNLFLNELGNEESLCNKIKHLIATDPDVCISSGKINIKELSRKTGASIKLIKNQIGKIKKEYSNL